MPTLNQIKQAISGEGIRPSPDRTDDESAWTPVTPAQARQEWDSERNSDLSRRSVSQNQLVYSAQDVRQGEIILKRRWQGVVFILGLAGAVVLAAVLRLAQGF
jgi:hypothetical protein